MKNKLPQKISFSPDVIFEPLQDEALLFDMVTEDTFVLNEQGMRMWQLLSENGEPGAAVKQMLTEYEVDEAALRQDMAEWIAELVELRFASVGANAS